MSRRQHTRLIISVEVPVPVGKTQAWVIENVRKLVRCDPTDPGSIMSWGPSVIVKLLKKETTYL